MKITSSYTLFYNSHTQAKKIILLSDGEKYHLIADNIFMPVFSWPKD